MQIEISLMLGKLDLTGLFLIYISICKCVPNEEIKKKVLNSSGRGRRYVAICMQEGLGKPKFG